MTLMCVCVGGAQGVSKVIAEAQISISEEEVLVKKIPLTLKVLTLYLP